MSANPSKIPQYLVIFLLLVIPMEATSYSGGITGQSSAGCTCHSQGTTAPSLSGLPGGGYEPLTTYSLSISATGGVSGTNGGFNLAATSGTFSNPGSNVQLSNGEATHTNYNARSWTLDWTAPSSGSGDVTLNLAVNYVNGNGNSGGDSYGVDSWVVQEVLADSDNDGVADGSDLCPNTPGGETVDAEGCSESQLDDDGDGVTNDVDLCPNTEGGVSVDTDGCASNQRDSDGDGWSDAEEQMCSTDPESASSTPIDTDGDSECDFIDGDDDGDGVDDALDAFPLDDSEHEDSDGDGIGNNADSDDDGDGVDDGYDHFPLDANEQVDTDGDGIGDNADLDDDGDSVSDEDDAFPLNPNEQVDTDGDGIGDNTDSDDDGDGWSDLDEVDCRTDFLNASDIPSDSDMDGICDRLDSDIDDDGVIDSLDAFPLDGSEQSDSDGDGIGDNGDLDDDNDGTKDENDAFPNNPLEWLDSDGDGVGDNSDDDDDNDGFRDFEELACLSDPRSNLSSPTDYDDDGYCDAMDSDDDDDDWKDDDEQKCSSSPLNSSSIPVDTDGDGLCDPMDNDDDGDGVNDEDDFYPLDATRSVDEMSDSSDALYYSMIVLSIVLLSATGLFLSRRFKPSHLNVSGKPSPDVPMNAFPIPDEGLPEGWTEEQWRWYGEQWLRENGRL